MPLRIGFALQPPGWDRAFHVPLRPPEQNNAAALAAALEQVCTQSAGGLDLFNADPPVQCRVTAVWPLGVRPPPDGDGLTMAADADEEGITYTSSS